MNEQRRNARSTRQVRQRGSINLHVIGIVFLLGCTMLMSACNTVDFDSTFNADGSATHTLVVVFKRGLVPDAEMRRLERQIDAAEQRAQQDGYTTERIDSETEIGIRVSGTTQNAFDTGAALNGIYNSLVREAAGPIAPFVGTFDRESSAIGGATFVLDLTVDGNVLFRSVQEMGPGNRQLATREGVDEIVSFSYTASMPGQIRSADGELLEPGTVKWSIPVEGSTRLYASSTAGRESPWLLIVGAVTGSLLLVGVVGGGIAWLLIHRHRRGRATIPLVAPLTTAGVTLTTSDDPSTVTVQDVGSSIARAMEQVIQGADSAEALVAETRQDEEAQRGAQPERD